jgi:hypothetical protein
MRSLDDILKKTKYKSDEIEYFMTECFLDFLYFAEHVLGFDIAPYHKEWYDLLEKFPRLCIEAYRGSGKTSFFAGFFIWKAIFNEGKNFLIVSNTFEQSKLVLKLIRSMIADNDILKNFMPKTRELVWKATELSMGNGSTFYARTYGEGVRGLRIDYLMCDEAGQYEDKAIFWTVVTPVVQLNKGKIIVIGTPQSAVDLLQELENNSEYYHKKYPAEINGKALWTQRYTTYEQDTPTLRSLKKVRKEMGELSYQQEYLLIPISAQNSLFPYELTKKALREDLSFLPFGKAGCKYYMGVDLSISAKGDFTVITIIEANADKKQIVKAVRFRDSPQQVMDTVVKLNNDFRPLKILIDKTGMGELYYKELRERLPNIYPQHFTYEEKYNMLMDLRREFERFNIVIPNSKEDISCYSYTEELLRELNDFIMRAEFKDPTRNVVKFSSGEYDDCVISLCLANKISINNSGNVSITAL